MASRQVIDPTLDRTVKARNTFNTIFPVYTPKIHLFESTVSSAFNETVDYANDSGFVVHNKDLLDKEFHMKVDRHVTYREEMLKVKNMRAKKH